MGLTLAALVVVCAAAFRAITGFGFALLAALGLSWFFDPLVMVPVVVTCDLILTGLILRDPQSAEVDWPVARLLIDFGFVGAVCGAFIAGHLDESVAKVAINIAVVIAALAAMIRNPPAFLSSRTAGAVISLLAGVMLSAFAVGGPLVVAWLLAVRLAPASIRGTLALFFGVVDILTLSTRFAFGLMPEGTLAHLAMTLPLALIGYSIGLFAVRRMNPPAWRRFSSLGLLFIALAGSIQTVVLLLPASTRSWAAPLSQGENDK